MLNFIFSIACSFCLGYSIAADFGATTILFNASAIILNAAPVILKLQGDK